MSEAEISASRRALRAARDVAQAVFEAVWRTGFGIVGSLQHDRSRPLEVGNNGVVLVVAPHPDDEVAGCGGTLVRHRRAGDTVVIAYVTDGRLSRALGLTPDQTAEIRRREATAAATALGIDRIEWFGLPEGDWRTDDLAERLGTLLTDLDPDIIYAPSRVDFHPGHHAVAQGLCRVLSPAPGPALEADGTESAGPTVRMYQVQVPLGAALVNRCSDISDVAAKHDAAVAAHASQVGSLARCQRMKRYAATAHGAGSLAEEFCELSGPEYVALHAADPATWAGEFRALRYLATTDPAAYLVGRRARRRLTREA